MSSGRRHALTALACWRCAGRALASGGLRRRRARRAPHRRAQANSLPPGDADDPPRRLASRGCGATDTEHNVTFHGFHSRTQGPAPTRSASPARGTFSYRCTIHESRRHARQDRRPLRLTCGRASTARAERWAGQRWPCPAHALRRRRARRARRRGAGRRGARSSKSSSSAGISTKRRLSSCACGSVMRSLAQLQRRRAAGRRCRSPAGRGARLRRRARARASSSLTASSSSRGSSSVSIRTQALRKLGWSSTSPDRVGVVGAGAREHLHARRPRARRRRPAGGRGARRR